MCFFLGGRHDARRTEREGFQTEESSQGGAESLQNSVESGCWLPCQARLVGWGFPGRAEPGCVQGRRECSQCGGGLEASPGFFRGATPPGSSIALERRERRGRVRGPCPAEPVCVQHVVVAIVLAACSLYLHIMCEQSVLRNGMHTCASPAWPAGLGQVPAARGHGQAEVIVSFCGFGGGGRHSGCSSLAQPRVMSVMEVSKDGACISGASGWRLMSAPSPSSEWAVDLRPLPRR